MPRDGGRAGSQRPAPADRRRLARESHLTCGRHPGSGGETRVPSRNGRSQQQKAGLWVTLTGSDAAATTGVATAAVIANAVSVMATSRRIRVVTGTSVGRTGADVT